MPVYKPSKEKKEQSQNLYFPPLGYSAILTPCGEETALEVEGRRPRQAKKAFKIFSNNFPMAKIPLFVKSRNVQAAVFK